MNGDLRKVAFGKYKTERRGDKKNLRIFKNIWKKMCMPLSGISFDLNYYLVKYPLDSIFRAKQALQLL